MRQAGGFGERQNVIMKPKINPEYRSYSKFGQVIQLVGFKADAPQRERGRYHPITMRSTTLSLNNSTLWKWAILLMDILKQPEPPKLGMQDLGQPTVLLGLMGDYYISSTQPSKPSQKEADLKKQLITTNRL
jgi:hypothetical protein